MQECLPLLDQPIATPASKQAIEDGEVLLKVLIIVLTRFTPQLVDLHLNAPSSHIVLQSLFQCWCVIIIIVYLFIYKNALFVFIHLFIYC
jgi:hypothetical protein